MRVISGKDGIRYNILKLIVQTSKLWGKWSKFVVNLIIRIVLLYQKMIFWKKECSKKTQNANLYLLGIKNESSKICIWPLCFYCTYKSILSIWLLFLSKTNCSLHRLKASKRLKYHGFFQFAYHLILFLGSHILKNTQKVLKAKHLPFWWLEDLNSARS